MGRRPRPAEGRSERLAREIVARSLAPAMVIRYDDGTQPGMPDAIIEYADGRRAALEVVGDHDEDFEQQKKPLAQHRTLTVEGSTWRWSLSVEHATNITRLRQELPNLLLRAEQQHPNRTDLAEGEVVAESERLGVTLFSASADAHSSARGHVDLRAAPFSGFTSGVDGLPGWVGTVLDRESDVASKLAAAEIGEERHAFIWVTIGTVVHVQSALDGNTRGLPSLDPELPDGVTHVWVVPWFSSGRGLAWFPDRGWHALAFQWSSEQPLVLTQPE